MDEEKLLLLNPKTLKEFIRCYGLNSKGLLEKKELVTLILRSPIQQSHKTTFLHILDSRLKESNAAQNNNMPNGTSSPVNSAPQSSPVEEIEKFVDQIADTFVGLFTPTSTSPPSNNQSSGTFNQSNSTYPTTSGPSSFQTQPPRSNPNHPTVNGLNSQPPLGSSHSNNSPHNSTETSHSTATQNPSPNIPTSNSVDIPSINVENSEQSTTTPTEVPNSYTGPKFPYPSSPKLSSASTSPSRPFNQIPTINDLVSGKISIDSLSAKVIKSILLSERVSVQGLIEKTELVDRLEKLVENVKLEMKTHNEDLICKICCDKAINCVLLECGHLVTCQECAIEVQKTTGECPICRSRIVRIVHTFRS
ncbi:RING finger protein 34 [Globomyces sp. JEL0801]|nr:RING finger protein 34 [Globomyces sp. JEL0801]